MYAFLLGARAPASQGVGSGDEIEIRRRPFLAAQRVGSGDETSRLLYLVPNSSLQLRTTVFSKGLW